MKVKLRVESMDSTIVTLSEVKMPNYHVTFDEYGLRENDPGYFTPIHALAQYLMDEWRATSKEMKDLIQINQSNLLKVCGLYANECEGVFSNCHWMYMINNEYPMPEGSRYGYNMANCPLKNGDYITIYAMEYLRTYYYGFFEQHELYVKLGERVTLTLLGRNITGGECFSLSSADLIPYYRNKVSTMDTGFITDLQGQVNIDFYTAGTYTFSAKRTDISRAYVSVIVIE